MKASVIIPTYNQADSLYLTLTSFAYQTLNPEAFEIIVVDDGSVDKTAQVAQSFSTTFHLNYVRQSNRGRSAARNFGVSQASGEILIFNDCDRAVVRDFLEVHLAWHHQQINLIVVGSIYELYFSHLDTKRELLAEDIARGFSQFGRLAREYSYAQAVSQIYDPSGTTDCLIPWISFFSGNVSLSHRAFEQVGGFDEGFVDWGFEHFELGLRLYQAGLHYIYEPRARNWHFAHRRPTDFYLSSLRASYEYLLSKHPRREIELLKDFISGELSLQEYETLVNSHSLACYNQNPVYLAKPIKF